MLVKLWIVMGFLGGGGWLCEDCLDAILFIMEVGILFLKEVTFGQAECDYGRFRKTLIPCPWNQHAHLFGMVHAVSFSASNPTNGTRKRDSCHCYQVCVGFG